jgi:hypothetical protein
MNPATMGVAILVPDFLTSVLSFRWVAAKISLPGAIIAISGPVLEKLAF